MAVKINLSNEFPEIYGLEENERPVHLLADQEKLLYLATDVDVFRNRLFVGKGDSTLSEVDKVMAFETYRDGGTMNIEFIFNSKEGRIYVPSSFKEGLLPKLDFEGTTRNLRKVCDYFAYLFNAYERNENNVWVKRPSR